MSDTAADEAYDPNDFRRMLLAEFPDLGEELEACEGLLHVEMGTFARFTHAAKVRGDWETYARCVRLADTLWRRPDPALLNALNVSYLENLDFVGPRGWRAWSLLTPALQRGWPEMQAYLEALSPQPKKRRR